MNLVTGDIIATSIKGNPYFEHKAIILLNEEGKMLVAHNSPSRRNHSGGNVVIEPIEDFFSSGRQLLKREHSGLSYQEIVRAVDAVKHLHFHPVNFNCNDFVYYVRNGKRRNKPMDFVRKVLSYQNSMFRVGK